MVNRPKSVGTAAETAVARYLMEHGWPYAERRSLSGSLDKGDITGTPGICWEVKASVNPCYPDWLNELAVEKHNSRAMHAVLVSKPVGVGSTKVGRWHAVMEAQDFDRLMLACPLEVSVLAPEPFAKRTLHHGLRLRSEPYPVLNLVRMKLGDQPHRNYRVMHLDTMIEILRSIGYGDPLTVDMGEGSD